MRLFRFALLAAGAALVLLARRRDLPAAAAVMTLTHFLGYVHVWEHHLSAVLVMGVLLLFAAARDADAPGGRLRLGIVIGALALLALPGTFFWVDPVKDPVLTDPSAGWGTGRRLALALPRVLPVVALFAAGAWHLAREGFSVPRIPGAGRGSRR